MPKQNNGRNDRPTRIEVIEHEWLHFIENIVGTARVYVHYVLHHPAYPSVPATTKCGCWIHTHEWSADEPYKATESDFWRWWYDKQKGYLDIEPRTEHKLYNLEGPNFDYEAALKDNTYGRRLALKTKSDRDEIARRSRASAIPC